MEKDKSLPVLALVVILLFILGSFGMGGYGMMGFGMGFGFVFMALFWGAIIWLAVSLINASQPGKKEEDPMEILKKRYASGEISKEQYEEMEKAIKKP